MKYFSILFILLSIGSAHGQNNGFLGKKNILSIDARILPPLYYNFRASYSSNFSMREKSGKLTPGRNLLDIGFSATLGHAFSSKFALMVQASMNTFDVNIQAIYGNGALYSAVNNSDGSTSYYSIFEGSYLKARSTQIMPIIELGGGGGLLPVGLVHQIGLGFGRTHILDDNYRFEGTISDDNGANSTKVALTDNSKIYDTEALFKLTTIMYKIGMRIPVNNFITYNIGLRYNINFTARGNTSLSFTNQDKVIHNERLFEAVRYREYSSFSFLETGISILF